MVTMHERTRGGGRERERERERETEALLSHHISRVYGVRGKEGQQTCRAKSDCETRERERGGRADSEGIAEEREKDEAGRRERERETHGSPVVMATPLRRSLVTPSA